jgi:hypothetical protein
MTGIPWQWEEDGDLCHKWALKDNKRRDTRAAAVADRSPEALLETAMQIEENVKAWEDPDTGASDEFPPEWGDIQLHAAAACRELAEKQQGLEPRL